MNRLAVSCYAGFLFLLWSGFLAAEIGWFNSRWLCFLAFCAAGLCYRMMRGEKISIDGWTWLAFAVAIVAMAGSWPPGHVMQLQWDPAIYIQSGVVLAREGGIVFDLPVFHGLPQIIQELVSAVGWHTSPYSGMVFNADDRVVPIFFHMFPVWVAYCYAWGGLDAALAANIPLYGLAVLLMFALVRRWFGAGWGILSALLIAVFPAEIWQSRFPTSELLAQVLLLGGFYHLDLSIHRTEKRAFTALLAGVSFGLAMMARFDSLLVLVPVVLLLVGTWKERTLRSAVLWMVIPMIALTTHAFLHSSLVGSPYFPRRTWVMAGLMLAGAGLVMQCVRLVALRAKRNSCGSLSTFMLVGSLGLWVTWIMGSWLIRPLLATNSPFLTWLPDLPGTWEKTMWYRMLAGSDAWNVTVLENLAGWPLLLLGVIGLVVVAHQNQHRIGLRLWALVSMLVWTILTFSLHHEREMMWMSRRYIPIVVPAMIIGAIASVHYIDALKWLRASARRLIIMLMVLAIAAGLKEPLTRVWSIREFYGTKPGFVSLANQLDRTSIIFADITGVGAVLRTVYGMDAFDLNAPTMDRRDVLMRWLPALQSPRTLVFITPIPVTHQQETNYVLRGKNIFSARVYEQPEVELPVKFAEMSSPFYIYEVVPYPQEEPSR